jgi:hypothetical protein
VACFAAERLFLPDFGEWIADACKKTSTIEKSESKMEEYSVHEEAYGLFL